MTLTSALSISRSVGTPRSVFLDFPLGHTAGKKHESGMQREVLIEALAAFQEMKEPGEVKTLPFQWSEDESWRENPMGGGRKEETSNDQGGSDFRTPRVDIPQYQEPEDKEAFEQQHKDGACGLCVGSE